MKKESENNEIIKWEDTHYLLISNDSMIIIEKKTKEFLFGLNKKGKNPFSILFSFYFCCFFEFYSPLSS